MGENVGLPLAHRKATRRGQPLRGRSPILRSGGREKARAKGHGRDRCHQRACSGERTGLRAGQHELVHVPESLEVGGEEYVKVTLLDEEC